MLRLETLVDFPANQVEFSCFPLDVLPGHEYKNDILSFAEFIRSFTNKELQEEGTFKALNRYVNEKLGVMCGTFIGLSASCCLACPGGIKSATDERQIEGKIEGTAYLHGFAVANEVVFDTEGEPATGLKADLYLIIDENETIDLEQARYFVPCAHLDVDKFKAWMNKESWFN